MPLIVWERRERERFNTWLAQHAGRSPISGEDHLNFRKAGRPLFLFAYQQLSPAERVAEAERLNMAIEADPRDESARTDALLWDSHVRAWNSERARERGKAQLEASNKAEAVLKHCTYLGGYPRFPQRHRRCDAIVSIGPWGSIAFATRSGYEICILPWSEIVGFRALTIEGTPALPPPGPLWRLVARLRPQDESALVITTTNGDAYFLIRGFDSQEAEGKLGGLTEALGQPAAESYRDMSSGIRRELIR